MTPNPERPFIVTLAVATGERLAGSRFLHPQEDFPSLQEALAALAKPFGPQVKSGNVVDWSTGRGRYVAERKRYKPLKRIA